MRRIPVTDLRPGQATSHPIYSLDGALLLPEGRAITERFLVSLTRWGILEVCVEDGTTACAERVPEAVRRTVDRAVRVVGEAFSEMRRGNRKYVSEVIDELGEYALKLANEPGILHYLEMLRSRDDYTLRHCINVGVISALIGKWWGLGSRDLYKLACAGSTHDVGKALVPLEILNKPGRLDPAEFEAIKKHPTDGYEALAGTLGAGSLPALVALEHHERMDKSGYPSGLGAGRTQFASRVVAVADVFDAMTTNRVYCKRRPEIEVLAHLREAGFVSLDPEVVQTFLAHMVPLTMGRRVQLSDGRIGRVLSVSEHTPDRPLVQVDSTLLDLNQERELVIVQEVDDQWDGLG